MPNCHELKEVQVYTCEECGLELWVVKEFEECGAPADECGCEPCTFICCGEELKLKRVKGKCAIPIFL
jgi:hypothetical protein